MKRFFLQAVAFTVSVVSSNAQKTISTELVINKKFAKADSLHAIMKRYTDAGLPGVAMAVYSESDGWWTGAEGFAKREDKTVMQPNNLQYLQSVSKTYMAVSILQLHEKGKIDLDAPITKYLPASYSKYISDAKKITVRMLLNHTSGIPEYSTDPAFVGYVIEHPTKVLTTDFVISTIAGKALLFSPGTRHYYTNTNYELLAVIADALIGDHAVFIAKNIFGPLGLKHTFYRNDPVYLKYPQLVNVYWDVLHTGRPANISALQVANVSSYVGDDGIVCTPIDAVKFLKGLMEGKLLSPASLKEMKTWVNDDKDNPIYGLGLVYYSYNGIVGYGHSGGGVGAGCILVYIPSVQTYLFIATNVGTLFEGYLPAKANQLKDEILLTVLQ